MFINVLILFRFIAANEASLLSSVPTVPTSELGGVLLEQYPILWDSISASFRSLKTFLIGPSFGNNF